MEILGYGFDSPVPTRLVRSLVSGMPGLAHRTMGAEDRYLFFLLG
jgi:hypothetical protein